MMSNIISCTSCGPEIENFNILKSYLPEEYEYVLCSFVGDSSHFKARLRSGGKNQDFAHKWLEDFQLFSKCTMRVERTYPHSGTKNVFKVDLRCQHNTRPRNFKVREKESCKNTDCPAKMGITVKRVVTERKSRSKDPHLPSLPTVIMMDFAHNHDLLTPEILRHRSVLPEVREKLLSLLLMGHTPATALDMHRYDLLLEHGENFGSIALDRAILPDPPFCYRLFYKIVKQQATQLGTENSEGVSELDRKPPLSSRENSSPPRLPPDAEKQRAGKKRKLDTLVLDSREMTTRLESALCRFCENGGFAGMQVVEGDQTVLALCSPLMTRAHRLLPRAADLIIADAYGETDEPGTCVVLLMLTYSCSGPIPLGCLVSTRDSPACLRAAVDLWKRILPDYAFHGREDGPAVILVGDSPSQRAALQGAFPSTQLLLAPSHLLRTTWNLVWDRRGALRRDQRPALFARARAFLLSQSPEELDVNYALAIGDSLVQQQPQFLDHLQRLYDRREEWRPVPMEPLLLLALLQRDPILSRTRSFNPLQAVDFVSRLDVHQERRLIDLCGGRFHSVRLSRLVLTEMPRDSYTLTQIADSEFETRNDVKESVHRLDVALGICECRTGRTGAPCKHQLLIYRNFPVPVYDCIPPATQAEKKLLMHLVTGREHDDTNDFVPKSVPPALQPQTGSTPFFLEEPGAEIPPQTDRPDLQQQDSAPFFLEEPERPDEHLMPDASFQTVIELPSNPALSVPDSSLLDPGLALEALREPLEPLPESDPEDLISRICERLRERCASGQFRPALSTFLRNLDAMAGDAPLEHALYSFGKFSPNNTFFRRTVVGDKLLQMHSTGKTES